MHRTLLAIVGLVALAAMGLPHARTSADEATRPVRSSPSALPPDAIRWETSWEAAAARARQEGKPILALFLFGRLDEEFC